MSSSTIEIFKTNINCPIEAENLLGELSKFFPQSQFNFDLEDCDKILRVKGGDYEIEKIETFVKSFNYDCTNLI